MSRMPSGCWTYIVPLGLILLLLGFNGLGNLLNDFAGHQGLPAPAGSAPAEQEPAPPVQQGVASADTSRPWAGTWEGTFTNQSNQTFPIMFVLAQTGTGSDGVSGSVQHAGGQCPGSLSEVQGGQNGMIAREVDSGSGCINVTWALSLRGGNTTMILDGTLDRGGELQGALARTH